MFTALEGMVAEVLTSRTQQGLMPFKPRNEALQAHEDVAAAVAGGDAVTAETADAPHPGRGPERDGPALTLPGRRVPE